MSFLRLLDGILGIFDAPCTVCGGKKSSNWTHDNFPNKAFCTKKCLNQYLIRYNTTRCNQCNGRVGTNAQNHWHGSDPLVFCKKSCANKYYLENDITPNG